MAPPVATILFLGVNPKNTERLRIDEEARAIEDALNQAGYRDQFVLEKHFAVRITDLQRLLLKYRPQIVHFAGHGSEAGGVVFEDAGGSAAEVPPAAFARLFALLQPPVACVVLNACFSLEQATGIAAGVGCVAGMSNAFPDDAAISFAGAFYQALGFGEPIQAAFDLACLQIDLESRAGGETPTLLAKEGAGARTFAKPQGDDGQAGEPRTGAGPTFSTQVTGGEVGQVINVDKLEGGLTIGGR